MHWQTQITQTADKSLAIELRGESRDANCNECWPETGRIKWNLLNSIPRNKLGQNKKTGKNSSSRKKKNIQKHIQQKEREAEREKKAGTCSFGAGRSMLPISTHPRRQKFRIFLESLSLCSTLFQKKKFF